MADHATPQASESDAEFHRRFIAHLINAMNRPQRANGLGKVGKKTCVMFTEHFSGTTNRPDWAKDKSQASYAPS